MKIYEVSDKEFQQFGRGIDIDIKEIILAEYTAKTIRFVRNKI